MTNDEGCKPEGAPERSPKAGEGTPSDVDGNGPKRFSVQRKMAIVARLLRGEPLDLVARQTNAAPGSPSGAIGPQYNRAASQKKAVPIFFPEDSCYNLSSLLQACGFGVENA